MSETIRLAYDLWPLYNRRLRDVVAGLADEQLAIRPSPERWPMWATIGHMACQRVFTWCDLLGAPGAETTPFVNAAWDCPGDDDLEHVWSAEALADVLDSTFRIVERCLDEWTVEMLADEFRREGWGHDRAYTRGFHIQRNYTHDVYHIAELNEMLRMAGATQVDLFP